MMKKEQLKAYCSLCVRSYEKCEKCVGREVKTYKAGVPYVDEMYTLNSTPCVECKHFGIDADLQVCEQCGVVVDFFSHDQYYTGWERLEEDQPS